jgi:hypothetical protein
VLPEADAPLEPLVPLLPPPLLTAACTKGIMYDVIANTINADIATIIPNSTCCFIIL